MVLEWFVWGCHHFRRVFPGNIHTCTHRFQLHHVTIFGRKNSKQKRRRRKITLSLGTFIVNCHQSAEGAGAAQSGSSSLLRMYVAGGGLTIERVLMKEFKTWMHTNNNLFALTQAVCYLCFTTTELRKKEEVQETNLTSLAVLQTSLDQGKNETKKQKINWENVGKTKQNTRNIKLTTRPVSKPYRGPKSSGCCGVRGMPKAPYSPLNTSKPWKTDRCGSPSTAKGSAAVWSSCPSFGTPVHEWRNQKRLKTPWLHH